MLYQSAIPVEKMVKDNPTVKEVNSRVDKLAEQFQQGLSDFKKEFLISRSAVPSTSDKDDYFLNKFKEFEDAMNASLNKLKEDVNHLNERMLTLNNKVKWSELRRNYNVILIHGIKEKKNDSYAEILELIQNKIGIQLNKHNINECYRFGKKGQNGKPRPVFVHFCQRWMRDMVFYSKKKLKGSGTMFTEMLTVDNLKLFKKARELVGNSAWTYGGLIYVAGAGGDGRKLISSESDLSNVQKLQ